MTTERSETGVAANRTSTYTTRMATVLFTPHLQRHVPCPPASVDGRTVREALDAVFRDNPPLKGYVVDDRQAVRQHVMIFVDGRPLRDRLSLSDPIGTDSEIYVMQALSGG